MAKGATRGGDEKRTALVQARRELKAALASARTAKEKLDLLLSSPKAAQIVPTLPAEELYFTIKEVGLSDSQELVQLAGPKQFRAFIDLDAWKRDKLEQGATLLWLRAARGDEDEERYRRKLATLDIEVIELLLKNTLRIHDLQEDEDPELEGNFYRSPEGRYVVEFLVEGSDYIGIKGLLDDLYMEDPFKAARMLEAVRWELASELEESAYRWRTARMADLGFPELGEALSYYSYIDPDAQLPTLETVPRVPEGFFLTRLQPEGRFFDRAVALVASEDRDLLERQLVTVMNAAMVVEGIDPGELEQVHRVLEGARDTLSLGLEHAAGGREEDAARMLVDVPLKRIFQVGASLALRLKFRVDRLMKSGAASLPQSRETPLLDPPVGEALVALRRKRPLFCAALRERQSPLEKMRPFADLEDVRLATEAVQAAERICEVMKGLGFDAERVGEVLTAERGPEETAFVRFSDLFLTAVAREAVGDGFAFSPLRGDSLAELAPRAFAVENGEARLQPLFEKRLRDIPKEKAAALSPEHETAAAAFADYCVLKMVEDVGRPWAASGRLTADMPLPLIVTGE